MAIISPTKTPIKKMKNRKETFFRIKRNGATEYYKTDRMVYDYVWVNVETGNVYTRHPELKAELVRCPTFVYRNVTEKIANAAKIVK